MSEDEQTHQEPDNAPRNFVDRDMRPCDWETEARQSLAARGSLSSFGYQRMLRLLIHFVPDLFEERDRLRARVAELEAQAHERAATSKQGPGT